MRYVIILLFVLLIAAVILFFGQRRMLFPAPNENLPANLETDIEVISLAEGRALLMPSLNSNRPTPLIVYAHGNAEAAHWSIDTFKYLRQSGFAVLLLEYPGYAGTAGTPSAKSMKTAATLALNSVLIRDDIDARQIIVYGRSIGSGVACQIAVDHKVAALVLESPFETLSSLVAEKGFPSFLLRDKFNNKLIVSMLDIPIFIYHGRHDQLIPVSHAQALSDVAKNVELHTATCGHNDCPRPWPQLIKFFEANNLLPE